MPPPVRMSVLRDGHIQLRLNDVRLSLMFEGTLLVEAHHGSDTEPFLEYSGATQPVPMPTLPAPAIPPDPMPVPPPPPPPPPPPVVEVAPTVEPDLEPIEPDPEPELPLDIEPVEVIKDEFVPQPRAKRAPIKMGNKELVREYGRLLARNNQGADRMELLLRVFYRAERIAGSDAFTPLDEKAPTRPQRERFFAELKAWWVRRTAEMKGHMPRANYVLGKEAPPNQTPHGYVLSRVRALGIPKDADTLALNYARYNEATGMNLVIQGSHSIEDAHEYLVAQVQAWCESEIERLRKPTISSLKKDLKRTGKQLAKVIRNAEQEGVPFNSLFGGNVRVVDSRK